MLRESVLVIGLALVFSLIIKTWLMQAFFIPTGSMENTLVKDDRVIVDKLVPSPISRVPPAQVAGPRHLFWATR